MPFVHTESDVALFYRDWGAGTPVLFCAAWALSSVAWQYQMMSSSTPGAGRWRMTGAATDALTTRDKGMTTTRSLKIWQR